jgi:hypothetical protein
MGSNNSKNFDAFSDYERENELYSETGFYIPPNKKCVIYKLVDDNVEIKDCQVDTIELPLETDSVVRSVLHKFIERSSFGKKKYGTDLDRDDLSLLDWIQHTQEELMDATLYLEKLKKTVLKKLDQQEKNTEV